MAGDAYSQRRQHYSAVSGALLIGPTIAPLVLVTVRNVRTAIFVQRIRLRVNSPGFTGSVWQIDDSNGKTISGPYPSDLLPAIGQLQTIDMDFGPDGLQLDPGASLIFDPVGSDAHGVISWDAYQKPVTTADISANLE